MRKILALLLLMFFVLTGTAFFFWENFRGAVPAFKKPSQDITELINTTGMPLSLPEGFSISIFAKGLGEPRVMARDPQGTMLVSITKQGRIVALPDIDGDGVSDAAIDVVAGLNRPHGLAFHCIEGPCVLYIAESHRIGLWDYDSRTFKAKFKQKIVDLPNGGNHFTRTILFGPDNRLYVSIGSSCDVCIESDIRRAKIFSMNPDGSDFREFARGLRNAVFMALHPVTGKLWVTEMGRDWIGDNLPPDEINMVEEGKNYGWPICYGKNTHDTVFDKNTYIRNPCMEPFETSAYIDIPAHSAPLGLAFFQEEGWPEEYWYNLLVAYHGSWNRSEPTGYKVVRYILDRHGKYIEEKDFISGWFDGREVLGRPADILIEPGVALYISDDKAGAIYRIVLFR